MIIQCDSCGATYNLKTKTIPDRKTYVRCKNCSNPIYLNPSKEKTNSMNSDEEEKILIQCENCGTRYRVKKSRLNSTYSKIKCSGCGHVFTMSKNLADTSKIDEKSFEKENSSTQEDESNSALNQKTDETQTDSSQFNIMDELPDMGEDKYNLFLKPGKMINREEVKPDNESLEFEPEPENMDLDYSMDDTDFVDSSKEEDLSDFSDQDSKLMELSELPVDKLESDSEISTKKMKDSNKEDITVSDEENDIITESTSEIIPPKKIRTPLPIVEETEDQGFFNSKLSWVILIITCFIAVGISFTSYLGLKDSTYLSKMFGTTSHRLNFSRPLKVQSIRNLTSRKILYVVDGGFKNLFPTSDKISKVQLKGLAFDENRNVIETSIVYAGNILSKNELADWSIDKIKKFYRNNKGQNNSNLELKENQEIPFQIVFIDSESIFKNATVRIISYIRNNEKVYVRTVIK